VVVSGAGNATAVSVGDCTADDDVTVAGATVRDEPVWIDGACTCDDDARVVGNTITFGVTPCTADDDVTAAGVG